MGKSSQHHISKIVSRRLWHLITGGPFQTGTGRERACQIQTSFWFIHQPPMCLIIKHLPVRNSSFISGYVWAKSNCCTHRAEDQCVDDWNFIRQLLLWEPASLPLTTPSLSPSSLLSVIDLRTFCKEVSVTTVLWNILLSQYKQVFGFFLTKFGSLAYRSLLPSGKLQRVLLVCCRALALGG